jgi:ubiquinone/menaquinone biosynthesis C-methylase UbiE
MDPTPGETILDAGCGTGVFTLDMLSRRIKVFGLDLSMPMLKRAGQKAQGYWFRTVLGDITNLPFPEGSFDRVASITTIEFIEDARRAFSELFRVTKKGGSLVVATLNSLSPWAERRRAEANKKHTLFEKAIFRSPEELSSLAPVEGVVKTAIHFQKEDDILVAAEVEIEGRRKQLDTGAFVAGCWKKK